MAIWEQIVLVRDDDPYHAWAFERGHRGSHWLCPVFVRAKAADSSASALRSALQWLRAALAAGQPKLFASGTEKRQLDRVIEKLAQAGGGAAGDAVGGYETMFTVYAAEGDLFPTASRALGADFERHFAIGHIGRAIESGVSGIEVTVPGAAAAGVGNRRSDGRDSVCLAIVDDSLAFLNEAFDGTGNVAGTTRFEEIWFQTREGVTRNGDVATGPRLTRDEISGLLGGMGSQTEADVYARDIQTRGGVRFRALDRATEAHQPLAFPISHGTHVAATALAKFDSESPAAALRLYGVTVPVDVTENTSGSTVGSYFLAALKQAMIWSDGWTAGEDAAPLVVNFSYGFLAGPRDGSDRLNRLIADMIDSRNAVGRPTALVVPMGNAYEDKGVAKAVLAPGEALVLDWAVLPDDHTPNFIDLYSAATGGQGGATFSVTLAPPDARLPGHAMQVDGSGIGDCQLLKEGDVPLASCSEWPASGSRWQRRAFIALAPTADLDGGPVALAGRWQVRLANTGQNDIELWAFVQRDDSPGTYPVIGRQSYFDFAEVRAAAGGAGVPVHDDPLIPVITGEGTASALASIDSRFALAVGAAAGAQGDDEALALPSGPSWYAASGPRGSGMEGPDYSALVDRSRRFPGIFRAGTFSGAEMRMNGASVAAPVLAGYLAAHPDRIATAKQDGGGTDPANLRLGRIVP